MTGQPLDPPLPPPAREDPPPAAAVAWYIGRDEQQFGPVDDAELHDAWRSGQLLPTDLVWRDGFADWVPLADMMPPASPTLASAAGEHPTHAPSAQYVPGELHIPVELPHDSHLGAPPDGNAAYARVFEHQHVSVRQPESAVHAPVYDAPVYPPAADHRRPFDAPEPHGGPSHGTPTAAQYADDMRPVQANAPRRVEQQDAERSAFERSALGRPEVRPAPGRPATPAPAARHPEPAPTAVKRFGPSKRRAARARTSDKRNGRTGSNLGNYLKAAFFVVMLSVAGWYVWQSPDLRGLLTGLMPGFGSAAQDANTAPIRGFAKTAEATDAAMQLSRLWQVLKRYHPEWYADRVREATEAAVAGQSDAAIATTMMQAVAKLRRQNAGNATAAPLSRLKTIATLFTHNLEQLRAHSIDACFQFASTGEAAPAIVAMLQSPELTGSLQAQLVATFEAIDAGRRSPTIYPDPKQQDFDALVIVLQKRGWKDEELQLFSDSRALGAASPERVCRLVTEWFQSQLEVTDPETQMRLLVDSLRPVVAG